LELHGNRVELRPLMALELAALGGSWPVAASLAAAVGARGLRGGRRRTALNEALHELRRPLQVLALAPGAGARGELDPTLRLAVCALDRLDREINGDRGPAPPHSPLDIRAILEATVARWRGPAGAAGGGVRLRWEAGEARVRADGEALERALDNLLANALEHGGARIAVTARRAHGGLRISVADPGRAAGGRREGLGRRLLARASGRRRRGHGLRVVRRVASEHDGSFDLRASAEGTVATLELPLAGGDG